MDRSRRTPAAAKRLRPALVGLVLLVLLVLAGGIVAAVTVPGRTAPSGRSAASPPAAGSTTTPPPHSTSTTRPPATTVPATTVPSTTVPTTTVPTTSPPTTAAPAATAPSAPTTTTVPLTTRVPRPPAPPATVPATGVFTTAGVAPYLASEAKASIDMTATVFDESTGQTSTYWPTLRLTAASSMKLDILETLLEHAQASGKPLSAAQLALATQMIEKSTNTAAQSLWDTEGGAAAVTAYDGAAGLTETAPNVPGYWGLSTTGASDLVHLMSEVAFPGALLDDASRSTALGLLTHVLPTQAWGASSGVPSGVAVAIKNGWLQIDGRWEINTTAWIDGDGRDYVVAVMSWGEATGSAGVGIVDGLCSRIWSALVPT